MKKKIAIIGYSGHSYIVLDIMKDLGIESYGYYENKELSNNPFNLKYLGHENNINYENIIKNRIGLFVAIGNNSIRNKIINNIISLNLKIETIISPKAIISDNSKIGFGTLISAGAVVNSFAEIGKGVIINTNTIIEHEVKIGNFTHVAPGAVILGNVKVGNNTFIGANATIKQGVNIGNNVIIGAGAVVLNDIYDNEKWVGNPAKKIEA